MRKKIKARLRARTGETIGETLIALLIAALALVMLAGAITAAAKMITNSRNAIQAYEGEKTNIEGAWETAIQGTLNP